MYVYYAVVLLPATLSSLPLKPEECAYVNYTFVVVPVVSVETRIICLYVLVYYVVLVRGDPLLSYRVQLNYLCPLYVVRASVRLNSE